MKIKHGMVLAAGFGKRMRPLTLNKPKPLLEINDISLLERAINLLINCGVMQISINVHYLPDQIKNFLNEKKFNAQINISDETELLLDTGGGVFAGTNNFNDNPFFVINPDTLWSKAYVEEAKNLEEIYFKNSKPSLLLVDKTLSIDPFFTGDFNLKERLVSKDSENKLIFTGLHITKRSFLKSEKSKVFSMNKIWSDLIKNKNLYGWESKQKFYHLNTIEMYNKISSLKIID
jgi:MurNAc alpha-1-phosphate uridylyltransferase